MKILAVAFLSLVCFSQCKEKAYSLQNLPKEYLQIGSFGGFAGTAKTYYFFPNGQRFLSDGPLGADNKVNEIEKATKKDFSKMIKSLRKLDFCDLEMNETGNMTYFISLKGKKQDHKVQWGNPKNAPKQLVDFYRIALKNINTTTNN